MAGFSIRRSKHGDLDRQMKITDQAKAQLKRLGLSQWQKGYPNAEVWMTDVDAGCGYVVERDGEVVACFAYLTSEEESYREIDGAWLTDGYNGDQVTYASVHRVCVSDDCKGQGVAGRIFTWCLEKARKDGMKSVRIDTHGGNMPMQSAMGKFGFIPCGTIYLTSGEEAGDPRKGFEIIL